MPGFDINPALGGQQSFADPAGTGSVSVLKKKKSGKWKGKVVVDSKGKNWRGKGAGKEPPSVVTPSASAATGGAASGAGATDNTDTTTPVDPNNPLMRRFMTPNEIRAEAARLAALSVPSTQAIQQQYAAEQAGIQGLTGALSARLGDIAAQQTAGLAGFGDLYSKLAGGAQAAGQAVAAAAGAPAVAPGATPTIAPEFMRQAYAVTGYQPAAEAVGARLGAESRANLTKALVDRATKVSADTAKYLQSLRDTELQRAISQSTLEQNQARLGLSQQQEAWNQYVDTQRINQGWQRISDQAAKAAANAATKAAGNRKKAIQNAKDSILNNIDKWTGASVATGTYEFNVYYTDPTTQELKKVPKTITASNASDAKMKAASMVPSVSASTVQVEQGNQILGSPTSQQVLQKVVPILVNAGMSRKNAIAWVNANMLPGIAPTATSGGTFLGGVGGSVA